MKNLLILSLLIIGIVASSCSKKKWAKTASVSIASETSSNQVIIAGKPFVMDTLLIDFGSIGITGDRLQADDIDLTNSNALQANFITGNSLASNTFDIPQGTYDKMEMPFSLSDYLSDADASNVGNTIRIKGQYFLPASVIYDVDISLNITSNQLISILDNDNEERILIEEGVARTLMLTLDTEKLFSEITPGLWNAAAVTSVNGAQTIAVSELNNQSIYNGILAGFSNSITAKFE